MKNDNENDRSRLLQMEAPGFELWVREMGGRIHVYVRGRMTALIPRGCIDDLIGYLGTLRGEIELHLYDLMSGGSPAHSRVAAPLRPSPPTRATLQRQKRRGP